jgi:hypothetical protein
MHLALLSAGLWSTQDAGGALDVAHMRRLAYATGASMAGAQLHLLICNIVLFTAGLWFTQETCPSHLIAQQIQRTQQQQTTNPN